MDTAACLDEDSELGLSESKRAVRMAQIKKRNWCQNCLFMCTYMSWFISNNSGMSTKMKHERCFMDSMLAFATGLRTVCFSRFLIYSKMYSFYAEVHYCCGRGLKGKCQFSNFKRVGIQVAVVFI